MIKLIKKFYNDFCKAMNKKLDDINEALDLQNDLWYNPERFMKKYNEKFNNKNQKNDKII